LSENNKALDMLIDDLTPEDQEYQAWLSFSDIRPGKQNFLFPGIPDNNITLFVSDGGIGKGFVTCHLAAAVSTGRTSILDAQQTKRTPGAVILLNAEDSDSCIVVQRLLQAKANKTMIDTWNENAPLPTIEMIIEHISETRPKMIILDPLQSFVPEGAAMERRNVMRKIIAPLQQAASLYRCAVLIVMHTNKRFGASGRSRVADSADMWDIARSVFIMGDTHDGEGTKYISHEKNNYGAQLPTILYRIDDQGLSKIGETDKKDYDYIHEQTKNSGGRPPAQRDEAAQIILNALESAKDHELTGKQLAIIAEHNGISDRTFSRAKDHLIRSEQMDRQIIGKGKTRSVTYSLMD